MDGFLLYVLGMVPRTASLLAFPTLLLTACGVRARPPSAVVRNWDEMPLTRPTLAPGMGEAAVNWRLPESSPWVAYDKMTLLASLGSSERIIELPHVQELGVVIDAQYAADCVASAGLPADAMWVVDLRGAASVAFGATLSASSARAVAPVMTFNNWPARNEFVPAEETLAALVTMRPKLPGANDPGAPVFLLDAWRLAYRDVRPDDSVTDNRYMLTPADLPDARVLASRGIHRVVYVVEDLATTSREEDDLHATFHEYQEAGITLSIVDLRWLAAMDLPARWDERLAYQSLYVQPRRTIVEDELFYRRAHGGFGGVHVYAGGVHGFGASAYGGHGGSGTSGGHGGG